MDPVGKVRSCAQQIAATPKDGKTPRKCACGCGEMTKGGLWRPGHDAKYQSILKGPKPQKPDKRIITVSNPSEVGPLVEHVRETALLAAQALVKLTAKFTANKLDGLEVLRKIKFDPMGWDPLDDPPRSLNLIEQVNQTWTCLVSLKALSFLFARHPNVGGFKLNLGTQGGTDILSVHPDAVAAEGFAVVTPRNNKKLTKDLKKLEHSKAKARYVFFAAPGVKHGRQGAREMYGIEVWGIDV